MLILTCIKSKETDPAIRRAGHQQVSLQVKAADRATWSLGVNLDK